MNDQTRNAIDKFWVIDLLVILLCISGAALSFNLFRLDLFQTLDAKNQQPVGTIIVKNNIVQRRLAGRVLWDRPVVSSPVYSGDLIRTAELSSALLQVEDASLDLDENTLIRIQRMGGNESSIQIDLGGGSIGLVTGDGGGNANVTLNIMGRQVETASGTVLNASAGNDGMVLSVSEGIVTFIGEEGERREVSSGTLISLDASGSERAGPAAVVMRPLPNSRYLKSSPEPLNIGFVWGYINPEQGEGAAAPRLRLEIAGDRNFNRIIRTIENPDAAAETALAAGQWYWRLCLTDTGASLYESHFTIMDAAGSELVSPATDSLFRFGDSLPQIRFQWPETTEASAYILEVSPTPDFLPPRLSMQTTAVFFIDSSLGPGTWYWRVKPVFPSVYEGSAAFSPVSFFYIERDGSSAPVTETLPELVTEALETITIIEEPEPLSDVPAAQTQPAAMPPAQSSRYMALSNAPWTADVTGENALIMYNSSTRTSVNRETINGQEREVVTVGINLARGNEWVAGYTIYDDTTAARQLQQGSGIRFKALGDGQTWYFQILTRDIEASDFGYYEAPIPTQSGRVVEIDVPYSRLRQPEWAKNAPFNRNSIWGLQFNKHSDAGRGASTIKVFDIEVYNASTAQTPPAQSSRYLALSNVEWIPQVAGENSRVINNSSARFSIDREPINGQEREVLTMNTSLARENGWVLGQFMTYDGAIAQQLRQGSGVRFKALGDGQTWIFQIITREAEADGGHYETPIQTQNGRVVEIDIPYSRLGQLEWANKVPFVRNSIRGMHFQRHERMGRGASTIKIFDIEIYDTPTLQTPPAAVAAPAQSSRYIALSSAQWIPYVDAENSTVKNNSSARFSANRESIDGQEREVLTIDVNLARGNGWVLGQVMMHNNAMIQQLRNGSGVRFKALGDGKTWIVQILTSEVRDERFYEASIRTRNGRVVEIDIPYSRLRQPEGARSVRFNKNSINDFHIQANDRTGRGALTIKIFDFEIY